MPRKYKRPSRKAAAPGPQRIRGSFLDLSPEIRNTIYELISLPSPGSFCQFFVSSIPWPGPMMAMSPGWIAPISNIAKTCRQVREEYLSRLLPNRMMLIKTADPVRYWNHHLDGTFKRHLGGLTLLGPAKRAPPVDGRCGPYTNDWNPPEGPNVEICAVYTNDPNISARTQFCFLFTNWRNESYPRLTETSEKLIRDVLSDIYSSGRKKRKVITNGGAELLVRAVDRLKELPLTTWEDPSEDEGVEETHFQYVEYRCLILDGSPRRLRTALTTTWYKDLERRFDPITDEGCFIVDSRRDELL